MTPKQVMKIMNKVFLGLGSNIGNRLDYLNKAKHLILKTNWIIKESSIYETAPIGFIDQDAFLNQVILIKTKLSPNNLLDELLSIEKKLSRIRTIKWGPRTIDLDILIYNDLTYTSDNLILPHPGIRERRFVIEPLLEIAPSISLPNDTQPLSFYINGVQSQKIEKLNFTQKNIVFSS